MANVTARTTSLGTLMTSTQLGLDEVTFNPGSGVVGVKNLFNSSQNLLAGNWGFSAGESVTTGAFFTAPDGTQTAQQMAETIVTNSHILGNYGQCYAGLPYTFSVYLKKGVLVTAPDWVQLGGYYLTFNSCFANFNLTTGQIGIQAGCTATITSVGPGWYRCTITTTCTTTYSAGEFWVGFVNNTNQNARFPSYLGSATSDMLVWGAQMEQSSLATSYQPTAVSGALIPPSWANKTTLDALYSTGDLDEVTYNSTLGFQKNLLVNSNWLGGTSGAWGGGTATLPTGYVGTPSSGAVTFAPAQSGTGNSITFFGNQSRDYLSQYTAFNIAPNTNYVFSVQIEAIPVPEQPADIFIIVGVNSYQYNFNYSFYLNGVSVPAYTPLTQTGLLSVVFSNPGYIPASAFSALMRIGFGTSNTDLAGGIRLSNPQIELGSTPTIYQPTNATGIATVNFARRDTAQGNIFVSGNFDEFTGGMQSVTSGLIYNIDPARAESYPGTGTAVKDLSGTYPTSTLVGGFAYTSDYGGIWRLDGAGTNTVAGQTGTGYINTNIPVYSNLALDIFNPYFTETSNFTMSVWCRFEKARTYFDPPNTNTVGGIIGAMYFGGFQIEWYTDTSGNITGTGSGGVVASVRTGNSALNQSFETFTSGIYNLQLNFWYNFTMVYTSTGQFSLYYNTPAGTVQSFTNGQAILTGSWHVNLPTTIAIGRADVEGGGTTGLGRQTFPGSIGQCLIYNRALSAAEVTQNFQDTRTRYGV